MNISSVLLSQTYIAYSKLKYRVSCIMSVNSNNVDRLSGVISATIHKY